MDRAPSPAHGKAPVPVQRPARTSNLPIRSCGSGGVHSPARYPIRVHDGVPATFRTASPRDAVRGGVRVYRHDHTICTSHVARCSSYSTVAVQWGSSHRKRLTLLHSHGSGAVGRRTPLSLCLTLHLAWPQLCRFLEPPVLQPVWPSPRAWGRFWDPASCRA